MSKLCYFDITAKNMETIKKFYGELLGWQFKKWQAEGGPEYWQIHTGNEQASMAEAYLGAGIMGQMKSDQAGGGHQGFLNYFAVTSVDKKTQEVKQLGGKVIVPKMPVKGMGYFIVCLDTEGNKFALWESNPTAA